MNDEIIKMEYMHLHSNQEWVVKTDGQFITAIRDCLIKDGIPEESVSDIVFTAAKTLGYCPNPDISDDAQKTGLLIGKVQSGKTSNFITLTALAFDNRYDIVIVLGGTKNALVQQNSDRIKEYFRGMDDEVYILNTNENIDLIDEQHITQFIKMGKKIILVTLKRTGKINTIRDRLFHATNLCEKPVLIIDDEGDEASLNTLVKKGRKSPTYKSIETLKASINRHCYVSVTATPQANMLINAIDVLSPDFGLLVDPGDGYCGLDVFHGFDSRYTIPISEKETSLLDDGIPNSLYNALSLFFVGCGIRSYRGLGKGEKHSMLIHPSQLQADHNKVFGKVEAIYKKWCCLADNTNDISYKKLCNLLKSAYAHYAETIELPSFDVIEPRILEAFCNCGRHVVNGNSVPNNADKYYPYNIYIGGNLLGRGLTLKGLAITYIIRTAKGISTVDTVQQRARWFGYKTSYIDLCRVFASPKIIKEFAEIRDHEEDLWDTVQRGNLQGTRFKDIARIFVLSDTMRMTRANVASTQNYSFSFWNYQRVFQSVPEYIKSNSEVINRFRQKHFDQLQPIKFGNAREHIALYNMLFDDVKIEIIDQFIFPTESKLNTSLVDKLHLILKKKGICPKIDVIWMRDGIPAIHPVIDGHISNYMVGRRPQDKSKPIIYPGDQNMKIKRDVMQLQIHYIQKKDSNECSHTLALYVPVDYISEISNLVIRG